MLRCLLYFLTTKEERDKPALHPEGKKIPVVRTVWISRLTRKVEHQGSVPIREIHYLAIRGPMGLSEVALPIPRIVNGVFVTTHGERAQVEE